MRIVRPVGRIEFANVVDINQDDWLSEAEWICCRLGINPSAIKIRVAR